MSRLPDLLRHPQSWELGVESSKYFAPTIDRRRSDLAVGIAGTPHLFALLGQSIKPESFSMVSQPPNACEGRGKCTKACRPADQQGDQDLIFDSLLRIDT
jgi:hypothetical protein